MTNVNTRSYWDERFASGDWEAKSGRLQTEQFARGQIKHIPLDKTFCGTLLDFGCGLGDAIPVYAEHYPQARLIGVDISESAIDICRQRFGSIATFFAGEAAAVPPVDAIIASNIFEHLDDDVSIARTLLSKCSELFIVVPYREHPLFDEHVRSYDEAHFAALNPVGFKVFPCRGWSQYGLRDLVYQVHIKNLGRALLGRPLAKRRMQILFHFKNH